MIELTDTHCHIHEAHLASLSGDSTQVLWAKAADGDPDNMITRARQKDVTRLICVGCTLADSQRAVDFVQNRSDCWASVGLHPHEAKDGQEALDGIAKLASSPKVVAIGETGLDYFYNNSNKQEQQKALRFQIELALERNLPLIFHVREAFDDFWPIFDSYKGIRGVLHSYTDSHANFGEAMKRDLLIGMNGIMTFTKVDEQLQIVQDIPLQKLLIETDAPFLTPRPLRGTVNEPAHARIVAEFLAATKQVSLEDLAAHTTKNALTLFSLSPTPKP